MSVSPAADLPEHVAGELLVQFSEGAGAAGRAKALAAVGGSVLEVLRSEGSADTSAQLLRVSFDGSLPTAKAIEVLSKQAGVAFAEPNYLVNTQALSNDTHYASGVLWGARGDASGSTYGTGADEVWGAGHTGSMKTVVGVIDSGIDYRHPDLYLNVWLNPGEIPAALRSALKDIDADGLITFRDLNHADNRSSVTDVNKNGYIDAGDLLNDARWENGQDEDGNGYRDDLIGWDFVNSDNDPLDDNNHGTHVAGTIGGIGGNGTGVAGMNWSTQLVGLKFLSSSGGGSISNAINALNYYTSRSLAAAAGSDFVGTNNSWGGGGYSQGMLDALVRTAKAGNLFVAAAGNGGSDGVGDNNDSLASYPSNYSTLSGAGWDAVVAVAALNSSGSLTSFSNYGNLSVDLAAPGAGIWSTVPGGGYASYSGTSMASPHMMGALALMASAMPGATPQQLLDTLKKCVAPKADIATRLAWDGWLDAGKLVSLLSTMAQAGPSVVSATFSDSLLSIGQTAIVTVKFSEAVSGFGSEDVRMSAAAGSLGSFSSSDGGVTWSATLSPAAGLEASGVTLSLDAGSYLSADGSRSGAAFTSSAFAVDTLSPTVVITLSDTLLTAGETARVTFTFSETVSGFALADVTATNGTVSQLSSSDGRTWSALFTPASNHQSTANVIGVLAGSYADSAGNGGAGGSSAGFGIDTLTVVAQTLYGTDGNDTLTGGAGGDLLSGVPRTSSLYGRGSVDQLTGGTGRDTFVLGENGRVFYDDGNSRSSGTSDYARITDFVAGEDVIRVAAGNTYLFAQTSIGGQSGLALYVDQRADEMIGFLVGVSSLTQSSLILS